MWRPVTSLLDIAEPLQLSELKSELYLSEAGIRPGIMTLW
jgi:hypothetical protein